MPSKRASSGKVDREGREKPDREGKGADRPGALFVVATPIGNLADITLRALDTLRSVQKIAAEDTRHTRKLLAHYDIHTPLLSYHSHNAGRRGPEIVEMLRSGEDIALVTDAGTPGISDPGTLLVSEVLEASLDVTVIPGPSAAIAALVLSGLPTHPFAFLGFAPSRGAGRRLFFSSYAALPMTMVLFEAPQRLQQTLEDILTSWGDRRIAVGRELTKRFEEVFRGTVRGAQAHFAVGARGELSLVVSGAEAGEPGKGRREAPAGESAEDWREALSRLLQADGVSVKDAVAEITRNHRLPRKTVYQEALRITQRR